MASTPTSDEAHIRLENLAISYGGRRVFDSLTCGFPRGRISVILGGSGSGKSTILRAIGRLVRPQAGTILVDGQDITRLSERRMYEVRRKIGMMFQGGALLDSYSIFDNVALPLREHSTFNEAEIAEKVHESLAAVKLLDVDRLLPGQLSGGMMRRAALARAIIQKPVILLCDEPFSGLDPSLTKRIEALLVQINRQFGMTMIVVSHHVPSTLRMADHVLLLLGERVVEGSPAELKRSTDRDVIEFLNEDVELPGSPGKQGE